MRGVFNGLIDDTIPLSFTYVIDRVRTVFFYFQNKTSFQGILLKVINIYYI